MKIEAIAVHGGYTPPTPPPKAVAVPIYQIVAYAFDNTQHGADLFDLKVAGNIYSRIMNPTQCRARSAHGGTYNLFAHTFPQMGIEVRFADPRDPASFAPLIDVRTKVVFCESVGNPLGNVTDIAALAEVAHAAGVPPGLDHPQPAQSCRTGQGRCERRHGAFVGRYRAYRRPAGRSGADAGGGLRSRGRAAAGSKTQGTW